MNEDKLKEIEALIDDANTLAIGEAVEYDSECFEAEREFADNAADHMRALIAEVRSLRATLAAVPEYTFACLQAKERGEMSFMTLDEWMQAVQP